MYARVTNIRFPPEMKAEVTSVARGLAPILKQRRGFAGLQVLTDPNAGEGLIVSLWETEADAECERGHPLVYWADEHDVEFSLRSAGPRNL